MDQTIVSRGMLAQNMLAQNLVPHGGGGGAVTIHSLSWDCDGELDASDRGPLVLQLLEAEASLAGELVRLLTPIELPTAA